MIAQLQDQIRHTENNIREEVNQRVENARTADEQEMQLLKSSLEEANKQMQMSQVQVIQKEELVRQLQAELKTIEGKFVNITTFQAQVLKVHEKIQAEQQNTISKIEIVQNYFLEISHSLDNIAFKEKEATTARTSFQKVVAFSAREEVPTIPS
jgi:hypothetical protein